jgi:hypothetical protein
MATPLYKQLKTSGSSLYVMPGAAEDLSASFENDNYKIRFTKFVLLNLKIEDFKYSSSENGPFVTQSNFNGLNAEGIYDNSSRLVNSLRNYVANHEVTIRESLINNNNYFYNPNLLQTTTERIFWKWLKKVGGIEFEPADPNEDYIDSSEFQIDENLPTDYFKEYLWRERKTIEYRVQQSELNDPGIQYVGNIIFNAENIDAYDIRTSTSTNLRPGDFIKITNNGTIDIGIPVGKTYVFKIVAVFSEFNKRNNRLRIDNRDVSVQPATARALAWNNFAVVNLELEYNRTVQYIGEVTAVNNAQVANRSYTEVYAFVPNQNGQTPDVLFRLGTDQNYSPGLQYPILPTQDQPEIIGAENFSSPIITNPELFPGDQYAQYDRDQKYLNSEGFSDRRRGPYYGIPFLTDRRDELVAETPYVYPTFDDTSLDGISIDFDQNHYTRMNIPGQTSANFDEFAAQTLNNKAPKDFKFNAVLWYYEVEDISQLNTETELTSEVETSSDDVIITTVRTTTATTTSRNTSTKKAVNLYGINFLNGLDLEEFELAERSIPAYDKLVTNGKQDGLSYTFSLNLNFNILNENVLEPFDPNKIYSLFGFDLFNEIMNRLAVTNEQFKQLIADNIVLKIDVQNLKSIIYNQETLDEINSRIAGVTNLLNSYSKLQLGDSETISVYTDTTTSPPVVKLNTKDSSIGDIFQLPVSQLYNEQTNIANPVNVIVPNGKDFLITVINDDEADIQLNGKLNIVLSRDLDYKQTCEFLIWPKAAKFNKKLNISIKTSLVNQALFDANQGYPLIQNLDLPIDSNVNPNQQLSSIFERWNNIPDALDVIAVSINQISDSYYLAFKIDEIFTSSLRLGDVILVKNMQIAYATGVAAAEFSGQYAIATEVTDAFEIQILISNTIGRTVYEAIRDITQSVELKIQIPTTMLLQPIQLTFNTGYRIKLTAIDRVSSSLNEKYSIDITKYQKKLIA